jgi:hypothetical protein
VAAGGAVLVHGLSVEAASLRNGSQIVASFFAGNANEQLPRIWNDRRLFLNWLKGNYSESRIGNPLSEEEARAVIANAEKLGLQVDKNPQGLLGLEKTGKWAGIPHFKVENIHIPVRLGFTP